MSILVGSATAFAAVAQGRGRVEMGPAAVTHLVQKPKPKAKKPPPSVEHAPPVRAPVGVHAWLGGVHDPGTVLAHARELQRLGLDLTVVDATLTESLRLPRDLFEPGPSKPGVVVIGDTHGLVSIEIDHIPTDSPLRLAGVEAGDQVLGIDGYRLDDESFMQLDIAAVERRGHTVLELARGDRHIVLSIHWPHV